MTPPARTPRIEATLLPFLRACFPGVHFGSLRDKGNPLLECVLAGEPQGMATSVSQYVRLRLSVIARREDGTGDFAKAQNLAADIIHAITAGGLPFPIVSAAPSSGPMRQADGPLIFAYAILLLQVSTT
ncbi:MAG: hypothetical protein M3Z40_01820 [Bifidobacterium sp.]|nr:hypothetical protein [Bifidobacterium sp.]